MNIDHRIDALSAALDEQWELTRPDERLAVLISIIARRVDDAELSDMQKGLSVHTDRL